MTLLRIDVATGKAERLLTIEANGVRFAGLDRRECDCLAELLADCGEPRLQALAGHLADAAAGEVVGNPQSAIRNPHWES